MKSPKIKVVKIPLNPNLKIDKPPIFPRLSNLYLEMFENKIKIKKEYVNKNYKNNDTENKNKNEPTPTITLPVEPPSAVINDRSQVTIKDGQPTVTSCLQSTIGDISADTDANGPPEMTSHSVSGGGNEVESSRNFNDKKINNELTRIVQNIEDGYNIDEYEYDGNSSDEELVNVEALRKQLEKERPEEFSYRNQINQRLGEKRESFFNTAEKNRPDLDTSDRPGVGSQHEKSAGKDLEDIINQMADSSSEDEEFQSPDNKERHRRREKSQMSDVSDDDFDVTPPSKYETPRDPRGYATKVPPSAADSGYKERPKFPQPENRSRQSIEDEKRELLFKLQLLKRSYPQAKISEHFSVRSDLDEMKAHYEMEVRRLSLDSTVEQYKTYMIGGFMACEYGLGHFCKLDMQGFAQQQISQMHKYEKLLIEIGEKSYVPAGVSNFPVEVRLMFMILLNAAIFVASKMIMKKTGTNVLNMINSMNLMGGGVGGGGGMPSAPPQQPKRKMRGPQFDPNNL